MTKVEVYANGPTPGKVTTTAQNCQTYNDLFQWAQLNAHQYFRGTIIGIVVADMVDTSTAVQGRSIDHKKVQTLVCTYTWPVPDRHIDDTSSPMTTIPKLLPAPTIASVDNVTNVTTTELLPPRLLAGASLHARYVYAVFSKVPYALYRDVAPSELLMSYLTDTQAVPGPLCCAIFDKPELPLLGPNPPHFLAQTPLFNPPEMVTRGIPVAISAKEQQMPVACGMPWKRYHTSTKTEPKNHEVQDGTPWNELETSLGKAIECTTVGCKKRHYRQKLAGVGDVAVNVIDTITVSEPFAEKLENHHCFSLSKDTEVSKYCLGIVFDGSGHKPWAHHHALIKFCKHVDWTNCAISDYAALVRQDGALLRHAYSLKRHHVESMFTVIAPGNTAEIALHCFWQKGGGRPLLVDDVDRDCGEMELFEALLWLSEEYQDSHDLSLVETLDSITFALSSAKFTVANLTMDDRAAALDFFISLRTDQCVENDQLVKRCCHLLESHQPPHTPIEKRCPNWAGK